MSFFVKNHFTCAIILLMTLASCRPAPQKTTAKTTAARKEVAELQLKDSAKLVHVKNQFYRSHSGQLFQLTEAAHDVPGSDTLVNFKYFDGTLPQGIDPLTFKMLDGWYAKDRNFVYSYRPTSGGMYCFKIDSADYKTFKMLKGETFLAADKKHLYNQGGLVDSINPANMKIKRDKHGWAVEIVSGGHVYKP